MNMVGTFNVSQLSRRASRLNRVRWLEDAHSRDFYDYDAGWRMNVFFERPGTCFSTLPSGARDVHSTSLTLTFVPATF